MIFTSNATKRDILPRRTFFTGGNKETYFSQMGEMKLRKLRTCSSLLGLELWKPGVKAKKGQFVKAHLR